MDRCWSATMVPVPSGGLRTRASKSGRYSGAYFKGMQRISAFVSGGTGYIGVPLVHALVGRGHSVRALARPGSEHKLPAGCEAVIGNALEADSYADRIAP